MTTIADFIREQQLLLHSDRLGYDEYEGWPCFAWGVELSRGSHKVRFPTYRMGVAHHKVSTNVYDKDTIPGNVEIARARSRNGRATLYESGLRVTPTPPNIADVLMSLQSDARFGEQSFEDFCGDVGYDTDSRAAYQTWRQCGEISRLLISLLGHHGYADFMQCTEE